MEDAKLKAFELADCVKQTSKTLEIAHFVSIY